ncbi:mechanosensitive ion channel family protein [Desulfoferrobacter suflitae]|uniref:mechanosensitive ion channel family protein n=1 Tax=Desulfoferrobacter suflitae TaxID=2865782 RepID=UPI0021641A6E|nr:mechanosensitive ion channel family protein [Desulfoferrobacter suflitae]MCK8601008.1 mechanosensitive ion channel [Desulfoferrobacter suflitae]
MYSIGLRRDSCGFSLGQSPGYRPLRIISLAFAVLIFLSLGAADAQSLFPATANEDNGQTQPFPLQGAPDGALGERLNGVLSRIVPFKNIRAEVQDGVVILTGTTPRAESRKKAEQLVSRFEGVVYVINNVEVESEVETRVNPAIEKVQQYLAKVTDQLPVIIVAVLVVLAFWLLSHLMAHWDAPLERMRINPLLRGLIRQLLRTVILLAGVLLALDILDVTALLGAIVGAAGLAGLAIGFGVRDIVENYLSGVLLSLRSPFTVNDWVRIDDHEGRVVRLTSREIILMTLDGNHVRIPNSLVFKSVIHNFTRNPKRRFDFKVGVGVKEDLVLVQELGCSTLRAMNGVMLDPGPFMRVVELGDFNVIVQFFGWVDQRTADFLKVNSEAIRLVKTALDKACVEMPEPIQTVRLRQVSLSETSRPPAKKPIPKEFVEQEVKKADVALDRQLEEQIEEDIAASDEKNLLKN